jgi:hypothetical protein
MKTQTPLELTLTASVKASIALLYSAHKESELYPIGFRLAGLKEHVGLTKLARQLSTLAIRSNSLQNDITLYSLSGYPVSIHATRLRIACLCGSCSGESDYGMATLTYHCQECKGRYTYVARLDGTYSRGFSLLTFRQVLENFCDQLNYDLQQQFPQVVPPTIHIAQLERLLAEVILGEQA